MNDLSTDDRKALKAAQAGVALCDRSQMGLLQLTGEDRLRFLHNQTTNDIIRLSSGEGCDTVFVTSTGRTLDLATAYITADAILVMVSPNRHQQLMAWMDRYIFPMDRVELSDISERYAIFTLIGPESDSLIQQFGISEIFKQPKASHRLVNIGNSIVRIGVGNGLAMPGYTLLIPAEEATTVWEQLTAHGGIVLSDRGWEQLRIQQGRPVPDRELTEDFNPLEAGLWQTISFEKGCYIGQETIARLNTYQGVKQRLWGIRLSAPIEGDRVVTVAGEKVGLLTSSTATEVGAVGLAYIRTKAGGAGLIVKVGEVSGELINVPFLTHEYYQPVKL